MRSLGAKVSALLAVSFTSQQDLGSSVSHTISGEKET
jgi:hypothetical protein